MTMSRPQTTTEAASLKKTALSSTASILVTLEQKLGNTNIPPTSPHLVKSITTNFEVQKTQNLLAESKNKRESFYKAKAELNNANVALEQRTATQGQNSLISRIKNTNVEIDNGITIDSRATMVESDLIKLKAELFRKKTDYYKAIEHATTPEEKAAALAEAEKTQSKVKEFKKEATHIHKLVEHHHNKIHIAYPPLARDLASNNLRIKSFEDLSGQVRPDELAMTSSRGKFS